MWFNENASILDYLNYFIKRRGIKIGFVPGSITSYSFIKPYHTFYYKVQASTKLRVNDIIYHSLYNKEINLRFYYPNGKFDILVFQKNFSKEAYLLATKYKKKGTKIILDINVNYFNSSSKRILESQYKDIINFIKVSDLIITTTDYLKNYILDNKIFKNVVVIPEIISDDLFKESKTHFDKDTINFLYIGYAVKAVELEILRDILENLKKKYDIKLITICERPPKLKININTKFIKFKQKNLNDKINMGDIYLAPRNLNDPYNLGHSFSKIGLPMAIGIPVIASPIPSYLNSPAIICKNNNEWYNAIEHLIQNPKLREKLGEEGIRYCKKNYSKENILKMYIEAFKKILDT